MKGSAKHVHSLKENQWPRTSSGVRTKKIIETNKDMETYYESSLRRQQTSLEEELLLCFVPFPVALNLCYVTLKAVRNLKKQMSN